MDLELRAITDDEFAAFSRVTEAAFGHQPTEDEIADWALLTAGQDRFAVFEEGDVVATGGAFHFQLTLPGGATLPAAGLTAIGVRATHRRRGLLTAMMDHHLDEVAGRGQPLSILTASESLIYGRYGYGSAADLASWTLPTRGTELVTAPVAGGRLRQLDAAPARDVLPVVYDRHRLVTPGALTRSPAYWDHWFLDRDRWRDGASARFYVVHESPAGEADGYAAYRVRSSWGDHGLSDSELRASEVVSADPEVEAALWGHLLQVDLIASIACLHRPVEDPLRWRLADPRRLQAKTVGDHLWVRILDVAAALGARGYLVAGTVVLDVADAFRPANSGRWRLEAGPDGASCTRTDDPADVALGIAELGALYLGGVRATTLRRAGRVEERTAGAVARLDLLLGWSVDPWCATSF